ncbi:MAG: metallophosphoesterase family protein [Planctomycetota bacterium]|jgi:hypothetical protein
MRINHKPLLAIATALAMLIPTHARAQQADPCVFEQPNRIVAMSTVGGWADSYRKALRELDIIDENDNWIAGDTHFIQMGEFLFQGYSVLECAQLLKELEPQAEAAGGKIHVLLGFFESMALRGDVHRIRKPNFEHLADPNDEALLAEMAAERQRRWQQVYDFDPTLPEAERELYANRYASNFDILFEHPGAWVFIQKFAKGTELGDWLRTKNSVIQMGPYLFGTGGIHPDLAETPLEEINDMVRADVSDDHVYIPIMSVHSKLPNWWREAQSYTDPEAFQYIKDLIIKRDIQAMIINHSDENGRSKDRWNLYQIMSHWENEAEARVAPASLEINKGAGEIGRDQFIYWETGQRVPTRSPYPKTRFTDP